MVERETPLDLYRGPHARRRGTLRWWRQTLVELAVLFTLVVTAEILLGDGRIGSFRVHPHPYWLVVLPMAASRGLVAGLLAAAVASVLYALGAQDAYGGRPMLDLLDLDVMLEPLLFNAVGFIVGEFRDVITDRYREQAARLADVQQHALRFRKQRDVLGEANRLLESRLVDHSAQFGNLIVVATRIELSGRAEVFEIALELVEEHCGAAASVLVSTEDTFDFVAYRGWAQGEVSERLEHARESDFVYRAFVTGIEVSGFSPGESPPVRGPLLVAPMVTETGVIEGLLCLDEIPTHRLNPSTVRTFLAIAEWIGAVLSRLDRIAEYDIAQATPRSLYQTATPWLGEPDVFGQRLRVEFERLTRYGTPFAVIMLQYREWQDPSIDGRFAIDRLLRDTLSPRLRTSDTVYRFGYPGCYVVLLTGTSTEDAEPVADRIYEQLTTGPAPTDIGPPTLEVTGPDFDAPDAESLVERLAASFREVSTLALAPASPVDVAGVQRIGDLEGFVRRLQNEVDLAYRTGDPIHVIDIVGENGKNVPPGLLALHTQQVATRLLRVTDAAFSVGPNHVVVLLPHTPEEPANAVAERIVGALTKRDTAAPYGQLQHRVFGADGVEAQVDALLYAVGEGGELRAVSVAGVDK